MTFRRVFRRSRPGFLALLLLGCGNGGASTGSTTPSTDAAGVDPRDVPIDAISTELFANFNDGDIAFSTPLRNADGLGPLYTQQGCDACHENALRGAGSVRKMSVVEADGITPSPDQSKLPYGHTVHPQYTAGATKGILPPDDPSVKVTYRIGPPVLGRGYMEAVDDAEIERVETAESQRTDGIHGVINHVVYASEAVGDPRFNSSTKGDTIIGRFGLKARIGTLDEFTADAFQGDMGITSPLRPTEFPNPDGLTDDDKPGIDVETDSVTSRAMYVRLLAIPRRHTTTKGAALFDQVTCTGCHTPTLKTRSDYPVANLAGIDAPIYTDFLLHDMGADLADGLPVDPGVDGQAGSEQWRTAPLIGLRFNQTFLHDGRAKTIEDAIEGHRGTGSEANGAIDQYDALSAADRQTLLEFVEGL